MHAFSADVISAVLAHMNGDHTEDNLLIVRAFAEPSAISATMTDLDGEAGVWSAEVDGVPVPVRVPWATPVTERAEIRREVVVLYREACARLGIDPREH